ncbi:MAG: beta-lactamase family protein, partial [Asgard group archaeon]|nr:beta-lactamase family protein [Asgard group archaeon]
MLRKSTIRFGLIIVLVLFGLFIFDTESNSIEKANQNFITISDSINSESTTRTPPNPTVLNNFLDTLIYDQLSRYNIPGMTVSVVIDDEIVLARGYGRSDYLPPKFVHNQTLFRIGSVSKTFTAIAALQLVEDGLIDLNTDVNEYLTAFQIPDTFAEPITLKHLLTHTPGFEEFPAAVVYSVPVSLSLEEILMNYMPDRVNPPGAISSYSNYGIGLIGYLIQELSGKSFEQYVEDEILYPLGMNHTSFRQPLAAITEQYFEIVTLPAAGSCSSTSSDMAILMLTLLNNGTYNGTEILQDSSVEMMFDNQFLPHEYMSGVGFGLYEFHPNNVKAWGHGGDTIFFHSNMILFPEEDLGFFISYNSRNGVYAKSEFLNAFIETFYPYVGETIEPMVGYDKGLNQYTGYYVSARRYYSYKEITDYDSDEIIYTWSIFDWLETMLEITTSNGYLQ